MIAEEHKKKYVTDNYENGLRRFTNRLCVVLAEEYEKLRSDAQNKRDIRVKEVYEKVPEIKEIDLKIAHKISGTTFYDLRLINYIPSIVVIDLLWIIVICLISFNTFIISRS